MSKNKKKKTSYMNPSNIPYAERLRMNKLANIAGHRDDAHLVELKLALVSLNETEGLGCVRLIGWWYLKTATRWLSFTGKA